MPGGPEHRTPSGGRNIYLQMIGSAPRPPPGIGRISMRVHKDRTGHLSSAVVARLAEAGGTVAVAESVSGGGLADAITGVPGSSRVFILGVVAYSNDAKVDVLGCDPAGLEENGAVSPWTAKAMAESVRRLAGSTWGVATTGVAGPEPLGGAEPGTVFVTVCREGGDDAAPAEAHLPGDRGEVKAGAVEKALSMLLESLSK